MPLRQRSPVAAIDKFCYTCHNGTGASGTTVISTHGNSSPGATRPPFRLSCITCHDPHGTGNAQDIRADFNLVGFPVARGTHLGPVAFQRSEGRHSFDDGESPPNSRLCVVCHQAARTLRHNGGAGHVGNADFTGQNCLECHPHSADTRPETADGFMPSADAREKLLARSRADLEVAAEMPVDLLGAAELWEYRLQVTNHGPQDAWEARLTFALPEGVALKEVPEGVACEDDGTGMVVCHLGDLLVGASRALAFGLMLPANCSGEVAPQVAVAALQRDPRPQNNQVAAGILCAPRADLRVALDASAEAVLPGEALTYTISVQNAGPSVAREVMLRLPWPAALTFAGVETPPTRSDQPCRWEGPSEAFPQGGVVCNWAALQPGNSVAVTVQAVAQQPGGEVRSAAVVHSAVLDLQPENNRAEVVLVVLAPTGTATPTFTPEATPLPPTAATPPSGEATSTPTPTATPTPAPSPTATPTPTATPAPSTTLTPTPTATPVLAPTATPTVAATSAP